MACMNPAATFQAFIAQLRTSICLSLKAQKSLHSTQYTVNSDGNERFYTDRQYHGRQRTNMTPVSTPNMSNRPIQGRKTCFVCSKPDCWSTRHTPEERRKSMTEFRNRNHRLTGRKYTAPEIRQFLVDFEGEDPTASISDELENFHVTQDDDSEDSEDFFRAINFFSESQNLASIDSSSEIFTTMQGDINGHTAIRSLKDKSTMHLLLKSKSSLNSRYSSLKFEGILIDTGAAKVSTAGYEQFLALKRLQPSIQINKLRTEEAKITFGIGSTSSLGTIDITTPIGIITFHVTKSVTISLLSCGYGQNED
ncbi:hypothetical protein K3495_g5835 [Podosphaera aphanis]|nr:hypothetical protein K3495_g5835 [Podosphaera aphanis]